MNLNDFKYPVVLLISLFFLVSCEHIGPQPMKKFSLDETYADKVDLDHGSVQKRTYAQSSNTINDGDKESAGKTEIYKGTGSLVNTVPSKAGQTSNSATGKFTLNFEDAELNEVVKVILNDTLNESYIIDPKINGKVTLQTSRPLTREELLPTLEMLLQVNGAAILKRKGVYQIKPLANAMQGGAALGFTAKGSRLPPGYQVKIIPLQYVGVEEMQEILTPMVSEKAILRVDTTKNLLMVAGTGRELEDIRETISIFDVDYMRGMSFAIYTLDNVDADTIINELNQIFSQSADDALAGMFKMIPIERLNAVLVITAQANYLDKIKRWISRLDKANISASGGVIVYRVQHGKAVELAATLNEIFTGTQSRAKKPSLAPGLKASEVSNKDKVGKKVFRPAAVSTGEDKEIRIIADENNNALVISATAQDYEKIRNVIKQLDIMPLQVLIDASILAIRLKDNLEYGVKWKFNNTFGGGANGYTGLGQFGALATAGAAAATGGFSYLIQKAGDVKAEVSALAEKNMVNVLSAPSLMVLNNHEAYIKVGDQVPIRTAEATNTNAGALDPIQTSSIEYRDTGVILTLTPRVNAGGVVLMDIEQKVDSVQPPLSGGSTIDSPTILQRQIKSSVAVEDGETLVLGGLMDEQFTDNKSGIPWLMDIPYLGVLFSVTKRESIKQELVVLITPHVVEDKVDARQVAHEYKRKLPLLYEDLSNIKGEQIKKEL